MNNLSSMSDEDLKAAYAQSDISSMSDDDLRAAYQNTQATQPSPPSFADFGGSGVPASTPEMDDYVANSPIGHILDAVGHGIKQGWGTEGSIESGTADLMKKAGVFNDAEKGQNSIIRGFNEAILRPAAAGLDVVARGLSAGFAGAQAGIAQAGEEAGVPIAGRDIAGMLEAFPMGPGHDIRPGALNLEAARANDVLGTEAEWKGISPPTEDFPAGSVTHYSGTPEATTAGEPMQPYSPTLSPDVQAQIPPTDIHQAARQIAPDTFDEYDSLSDGRDSLRQQIAAEQDALRRNAEAQAPNAAEIADLQNRMQDTTPRLAKKYQARLDDLLPERDAFLDDQFTQGALTRDTPEITAMRMQLQEVDYRMRDLAPDVTAAYRDAAERYPEMLAPPEEAPAPEPQPVAEPAAEPAEPVAAPEPTPATAPAVPAEQPPIVPVGAGAEPSAPVNIAADVSRRLVEAGRPVDEANAAGAVQNALWQTRAAAFDGRKGTAEDMYAREAPDIRAGRETATPKALELAQKGAGNSVGRISGNEIAPDNVGSPDLRPAGPRRNGEPGTEGGGTTHEQNIGPGPDDINLTVGAPAARGGVQGKIRLTEDGRAVITLFKSANASTFLHETGHDWLERMMRDAVDPDAPTRMKTDAETVRKYLGNDGGDLTTKQHEKFARSFERYFMEGRAPSAALARVFEQFKSWLTSIYQTVARLKAPITDDIRDVFDRLLSTSPERTTIAPDLLDREMTGHAEPMTPYEPTPKEPKRLIRFLGESHTEGNGADAVTVPGGLKDPGGDVSAIIGGPKGRPGLINNRTGQSLDDAALRAHEAGYFPEHGETRPEINDLLNAIREDHEGNPRYSMHDAEAAEAYRGAMARNAEIDRLASQHDIDTTGLTREQFFDKITERLSSEDSAAEIRSQETAHVAEFNEVDAEIHDIDHAPDYTGESRTLEDMDNAYRSEAASGAAGASPEVGGGPGLADRLAGEGEEGGGPRGRGAGDAGRAGEGAGVAGGGAEAAGRSELGGPGGREPVSDAGPEREPRLPPIDVKTEPRDFRTKEDREIEKAANIRLDKLNTPDNMSQALRDLAAQNSDFMDARYGTVAYKTQADIRNTRILLRGATSEMMEAAVKAASGGPSAIADWVTKQQRAAMIFDHLSTLSADWAHAGHELNKVMEGWGDAKNLAQNIQDSTGKTLFQLQQEAAAMAAMPTAEQAGKFASDMQLTRWQKVRAGIISYFINNLISGPITHMAYGTGNTVLALYKAVPETTMQAAAGLLRGAEDRVYFGEAGAQLYGMVRGARDGVMPAIQAIKTGIPVLPGAGDAQGALFENAAIGRTQAIPGRVGYVLETPSRVVAGIHTLFYSMAYSQEIARQAFRDAAAKGLEGSAFDAEVARLTSSPTDTMMMAADAEATRGVLMKKPDFGSAQYHLSKLVNSNIAAKLVMPFMQVGMNILNEGIVQRTPLAVLSSEARAELMGARGGAARDLRIGKIATGSMLGAASVGLAAEGLMTGGGPVDQNQRRVLEDSGWKAYSIKFGDTYVPFRKFLGPLGPLMAGAADMYEVGHALHGEDLTKATAAVAFGFSEVVADETWMAGLSNFIDAAKNWDTKGESYMRNLATSFIPFSVGLSQTARLVDPYARRVQTMTEAVRAKIPLVSQGLEPRIGIWGQPIASSQMVSPTTATNDPVNARLQALGIGVTAVPRKITGIQLSEAQYTQFAQTAGMLAHQRLSAMVQAPGFSELPAGTQTKAIQDTINKSRETARALMKMQAPAIIQQATQNKIDLRANGRPGGAY